MDFNGSAIDTPDAGLLRLAESIEIEDVMWYVTSCLERAPKPSKRVNLSGPPHCSREALAGVRAARIRISEIIFETQQSAATIASHRNS